MATINLGAIKFNWKGAYNSSTSYAVDDVVSSGGNSYVCIQAHSNQAVGDATAYWNIMSAKGTNGSAGAEGGTTTLTTRGDILYRGASTVARLPKGTAGYYLKQGANDPEWSQVSAGGLIQTANAFKIDVQTFSYNSGRTVVSGLNVTLPNAVASNSKLFVTGHLTVGGESSGDPGVAPRWEYSTDNSSWSEIQRTTWIASGHAGADANSNMGNSVGYDGWTNNEDVKHASFSTMCSASDVSQARYYRVTVRQCDSSNDGAKINASYTGSSTTGYAPSGNSSLVVMEMGV